MRPSAQPVFAVHGIHAVVHNLLKAAIGVSNQRGPVQCIIIGRYRVAFGVSNGSYPPKAIVRKADCRTGYRSGNALQVVAVIGKSRRFAFSIFNGKYLAKRIVGKGGYLPGGICGSKR